MAVTRKSIQRLSALVLSFLVLAMSGCTNRAQSPPTMTAAAPAGVVPTAGVREFQELLAEHGSTTFRAWDGNRVGGDSDAELTFFRDGTAHLFDWGLAGQSLRGNYHLHADGCLVIWIDRFRSEWPVMVVYRDDDALRLRPLNPPIDYHEETRATITDPHRQSYWNFRRLTGDDERQVLELIARDKQAERPPG
jgi:hypothetical protein